jgi:hypothetical protein
MVLQFKVNGSFCGGKNNCFYFFRPRNFIDFGNILTQLVKTCKVSGDKKLT